MKLKPKVACVAACLGLLVLPISCCVCCHTTGSFFELKYRYRVKVGMTLAEVENILGPGERQESQPGMPDYKGGSIPVVQGDEFYVWKADDDLAIWVGLREGKVHDKWFWAPSL